MGFQVSTLTHQYVTNWYLNNIIAVYNSLLSTFDYNTEDMATFSVVNYGLVIFFIKYFMIIYVVFFLVQFYIHYWHNARRGKDLTQHTFKYYHLEEHEVGSFDDFLYYLLYFVVIVAWYFLYTIFAHFILETYLNWILCAWVFLIVTVFCLPATTLYNMGLAFSHYVRGAGNSSNFFFETLLDFIAVSVIFIRFFIQNIRFILIFFAFFELYEYVYISLNLNPGMLLHQHISYSNWVEGAYRHMRLKTFIVNLLLTLIYYGYYFVHLTLLFVAQLTIFILLSFWLFSFLYTSFCFSVREKYLFYKRFFNAEYIIVK